MADFQWNTDTAYKRFCICLMSGCTSSSLSRNKSAARRICGISEYLYFFFFTYECVKSPGGEKKDKTVVIWKRIYLADITKVSPSLLVEDFAEILFTVFISMPVCDYDWSWGRNLCHVGYKATASHRARVCRLKKAKSRFPSGPEDIFLNVVLLQTWTAVIKHLKHPHQSQKPININYNDRCPQNVKTSVN